MVIIVQAGVYWGQGAMMAVHENAGTLIFLGWIAVFWYLMYRFVLRRPEAAGEAGAASEIGDGKEALATALRAQAAGRRWTPMTSPASAPTAASLSTRTYCEKCGREVDPEDLPEKCPACGNPFG